MPRETTIKPGAPDAFDPARLGVESHYSPEARLSLRRLILEDWQQSGVKLPTYMKLLARYIAPMGVPEDWLAKLSPQTMRAMLTTDTQPRHIFWACLYLYLTRKSGLVDLGGGPPKALAQLGEALTRFTGASESPNDPQSDPLGEPFALTHEGATITAAPVPDRAYLRLTRRIEIQNADPFSEPITHHFEGAAVVQSARLIGMIRDIATLETQPVAYPLP